MMDFIIFFVYENIVHVELEDFFEFWNFLDASLGVGVGVGLGARVWVGVGLD